MNFIDGCDCICDIGITTVTSDMGTEFLEVSY